MYTGPRLVSPPGGTAATLLIALALLLANQLTTAVTHPWIVLPSRNTQPVARLLPADSHDTIAPLIDASPWPMYRHDAPGTGKSPYGAGGSDGGLLWKFQVSSPILSSPAVGPTGDVYVLEQDHLVRAFTPSGSLLWTYDIPVAVSTSASPALDSAGNIYFGADVLYSLTPAGSLRWKVPGPQGTVILANGGTILGTGSEGTTSYLYALTLDGTLLWKRARTPSGDPPWDVPAVGCEGILYTRDGDGYLYALNLTTGAQSWRLFVGNATLGAFNAPTALPNCGVVVPQDGTVLAVSPAGSVLWTYSLDQGPAWTHNVAVASDGSLYLATTWGWLVALTSAGGLKWERFLGVDAYSSPIVSADGIVFIGSSLQNGTVFAINPDGSTHWSFLTHDSDHFHTTAALDADGILFLGSMATHGTPGQDVLYAIGNRSGSANRPPSATVFAPTPGTSWTGGTPHEVSYYLSSGEPLANLTVWVNYTYAAGTGRGSIAGPIRGGANPNLVPWTTPRLNATDSVVNVTAVDSHGRKGCGESGAFTLDSSPPRIIQRFPDSGATMVPINTQVRIGWSESMNRSSVGVAVALVAEPNGTRTMGSLSWSTDAASVTLEPDTALSSSTTYEVRVNASAEDASDPGNAMERDVVWRFTTGSTVDTTPPEVSSIAAVPPVQSPGNLVNLTAVVTDDGGVAVVMAHVVGPMTDVNLTMARDGGNSWFTVRRFQSPGSYSFTVWATDGAGNVARQGSTFVIKASNAPLDEVALVLVTATAAAVASVVIIQLRRRKRKS